MVGTGNQKRNRAAWAAARGAVDGGWVAGLGGLICAAAIGCLGSGGRSTEGTAAAPGPSTIELELIAGRSAAGGALIDLVPGAEGRCPVDESLPARQHRRPGGETTAYHVNAESQLLLSVRPLAFGLTRLRTGSETWVAVRAKFEAPVQRQLTVRRAAYPGCLMLVSIAGETRWADPNGSDWSEWVPIGTFAEGEDFVASILADASEGRVRADWLAWPEAVAAARATEASRRRALEAYACDPQQRAALEAAHPGAWERLEGELGAGSCAPAH